MANTRARLEVPIFGPDVGALAASLGAGRLELNAAGSYALGGTTPTLEELSVLLASLATANPNNSLPPRPSIRIMIRPRGPPGPSSPTTDPEPAATQPPHPQQDFIYTPDEFASMASSITHLTSSGLLDPSLGDGFVFGILCVASTGKLELDMPRNEELIELARKGAGAVREGGLTCVVHRAVDELLTGGDGEVDVEGVMEGVRRCGFDGVLTSGGRGRAVENVERLKAVVGGEAAAGVEGRGLEVIVGGGVRKGNLKALKEGLGGKGDEAVWFHSSCLDVEADGERFDVAEARGMAEQLNALGLRNDEER